MTTYSELHLLSKQFLEQKQKICGTSPERLHNLVGNLKRETIMRAASEVFPAFVKMNLPNYLLAPHNMLMMDSLVEILYGRIKFLQIQMPPGHGKTELCSIQFAAYVLGKYPQAKIVLASYSQQLAVKNSRQVRDVVRSPLYRSIFPDTIIREDKGSEREWETTQGGGVLAVGVGSALTGFRAWLIIIDDPIKDQDEASSATILENKYQWLVAVARTRLLPGGAIVMPYTSWSFNDPGQRLLRLAKSDPLADQWHYLRLPAIAEDDDILGRQPGEALWKGVYDLEGLLAVRAMDEERFQALFQQNPKASTQVQFDHNLIKIVDSFFDPENHGDWSWCWACDLAITENETSDYMRLARVGVRRLKISEDVKKILIDAKLPLPYEICVDKVIGSRAQWTDQRRLIIKTLLSAKDGLPFVIEKVRMDLSAVQQITEDLTALGIHVDTYRPVGDKVARKARLSTEISMGNLSIALDDWNDGYLLEFEHFPVYEHDDFVDVTEIAYEYLREGDFQMEVVENAA